MDKKIHKVTIFGQEVEIKFNMAALIGYEEITGTSFYGESFETAKTRYALICAVLSQSSIDKQISDRLLYDMDFQEFNKVFTAIMEAANEFFGIPKVMEEKAQGEGSAKN